MARKRNSERLGAPKTPEAASTPPTALTENTNDILSFVTPTDFVDLPSQGRYYPEGHPLAGVTSVELRHMTAKEEDILTSRALLKKGVALDRVISSVIVDKKINPTTLLVGD